MSKPLWINLPVKDLNRSRNFYAALGESFTVSGSNDDSVSVVVGDNQVNVMLFPESMFRSFTDHAVTDTQQGTEVLFSLGADSKEEVDELAKKAEQAGGTVFREPDGEEWMYGCGFVDPDGHRWNVLYMDMSKVPGRE